MKKILSVLFFSVFCANTTAVNAFTMYHSCSPCVHVHHSSDDWAGPMAFGAIMGTGVGLLAGAASRDRTTHCSRSSIMSDLEDQNDLLKAKLNSLREKYADLREENDELREQNETLRRKISKLKHARGGEVMVRVDACK